MKPFLIFILLMGIFVPAYSQNTETIRVRKAVLYDSTGGVKLKFLGFRGGVVSFDKFKRALSKVDTNTNVLNADSIAPGLKILGYTITLYPKGAGRKAIIESTKNNHLDTTLLSWFKTIRVVDIIRIDRVCLSNGTICGGFYIQLTEGPVNSTSQRVRRLK